MTKPTKLLSIIDLVLGIIFLILTLTLLIDLIHAANAEACSVRVYDGCYPWGAEGPAADFWYYKSQELYMIQGAVHLVFLIGAITALAFLPPSKRKSILAFLFGVSPFLLSHLLS